MQKYLIIGLLFWNTGLCAQKTNQETLDWLMTRNRYYEVLKYIDSLYRAGEKFSDILLYEGKANEGVLRYKEAYRCYSDWVAKDSTNRDACLALARVSALSGRILKAIGIYEKFSREDTLDFFVNYQLARLYQQNGKLISALQIYQRLHRADTVNPALLKRIGDCYNQMGWNANAASYYEEAFHLDPEDGKVVVKAANIMLTYPALFLDYIHEGMALVDSALVYSPQLNSLQQLRGMFLYLQKRYPECETVFSNLLAQGDSARVNLRYLGLSLFHMKRYKEAMTPLTNADSLFRNSAGDRTDFDLSMRYGEDLGYCKETQKALTVFREIEQQIMPDTQTLYQLAYLSGTAWLQVNDRRQAVQNYWKAYLLNPKSKNIIYSLLNLHYDLWTKEGERKNVSEKRIQQALFFHVLFWQKYTKRRPEDEDSYCYSSRAILQNELDELFFKNENKMIVLDPDGKKYSYSTDEIRELIKPKTL